MCYFLPAHFPEPLRFTSLHLACPHEKIRDFMKKNIGFVKIVRIGGIFGGS
jgi:hypothetical protein